VLLSGALQEMLPHTPIATHIIQQECCIMLQSWYCKQAHPVPKAFGAAGAANNTVLWKCSGTTHVNPYKVRKQRLCCWQGAIAQALPVCQ
jgi:hypothetical protein